MLDSNLVDQMILKTFVGASPEDVSRTHRATLQRLTDSRRGRSPLTPSSFGGCEPRNVGIFPMPAHRAAARSSTLSSFSVRKSCRFSPCHRSFPYENVTVRTLYKM
jgi:hypothetical protein